jgi:hypothetical protein
VTAVARSRIWLLVAVLLATAALVIAARLDDFAASAGLFLLWALSFGASHAESVYWHVMGDEG